MSSNDSRPYLCQIMVYSFQPFPFHGDPPSHTENVAKFHAKFEYFASSSNFHLFRALQHCARVETLENVGKDKTCLKDVSFTLIHNLAKQMQDVIQQILDRFNFFE